jgi:hypothetical protein
MADGTTDQCGHSFDAKQQEPNFPDKDFMKKTCVKAGGPVTAI